MEEYLQNFQASLFGQSKVGTKNTNKSKKSKKSVQRPNSGSIDSYSSLTSSSRPNSGSVASSGTIVSTMSRSSKSTDSRKSVRSSGLSKKNGDRGPLKVSINETAQLIEDNEDKYDRYSSDSTPREENNVSVSESEENNSIQRYKSE